MIVMLRSVNKISGRSVFGKEARLSPTAAPAEAGRFEPGFRS